MKKKMLMSLLVLMMLVLPGNALAASYVPPFEPDSASNPLVLSAGDWSYPTLTPGDIDYFRFTNTYPYQRTYTLIVESPSGFNYSPGSINGSGITLINPIVMEYGKYRIDIVCNPGAVVNIEVYAQVSGYSPNSYFILVL